MLRKTPNEVFGRRRSFWSAIGKRVNQAASWLNRTLDDMNPATRDKIYSRASDVMDGVRLDYSPPVRSYLAQHGKDAIERLQVRRVPIQAALNGALELMTAGRWESAKSKYGYDDLFHLSLIANGRTIVEKNAVVKVGPTDSQSNGQFMEVSVPPGLTLDAFLERALRGMGKQAYFTYDAFDNNCQVFIDSLLKFNGMLTTELHTFLFQPVQGLLRELPGHTSGLAKAVTTLGALADVAIHGK